MGTRFGVGALALAAGLMGACVTADVTTLREAPAHASGCDIDALGGVTRVLRPYEAVCLIKAERREGQTLRDVIAGINRQACGCGGDAVYPDGESDGMILLKVIRYTGA